MNASFDFSSAKRQLCGYRMPDILLVDHIATRTDVYPQFTNESHVSLLWSHCVMTTNGVLVGASCLYIVYMVEATCRRDSTRTAKRLEYYAWRMRGDCRCEDLRVSYAPAPHRIMCQAILPRIERCVKQSCTILSNVSRNLRLLFDAAMYEGCQVNEHCSMYSQSWRLSPPDSCAMHVVRTHMQAHIIIYNIRCETEAEDCITD